VTYTDAELLDALRAFADEHGRPPTAPEADTPDSDLPTSMTFANHFGSWNAAVAEAGFEPRDRRRSDAELLADLREFAAERGAVPSAEAVRAREDMATPPTYAVRFGSWNAALEMAGLPTFAANSETEEN
jgi:hypothetical protein